MSTPLSSILSCLLASLINSGGVLMADRFRTLMLGCSGGRMDPARARLVGEGLHEERDSLALSEGTRKRRAPTHPSWPC